MVTVEPFDAVAMNTWLAVDAIAAVVIQEVGIRQDIDEADFRGIEDDHYETHIFTNISPDKRQKRVHGRYTNVCSSQQ